MTVFGMLLLFNVLGLDLTTLAVLGGALGVGLGFGLQQIASNFISGIIILLERSLKVGGLHRVGGWQAGHAAADQHAILVAADFRRQGHHGAE
ncbi:MAG: mechanosensitive ion channel [Hyphomicrobiales bacterium]